MVKKLYIKESTTDQQGSINKLIRQLNAKIDELEGTYEECITEDWDPEEYGVVLDKNTAIFLDEYTFNPNSNWTKIWQSVIQPLIDKYFNAYDNWEDDLDFKINLFYDVFADKYPNVKRACNKFWDENDI